LIFFVHLKVCEYTCYPNTLTLIITRQSLTANS